MSVVLIFERALNYRVGRINSYDRTEDDHFGLINDRSPMFDARNRTAGSQDSLLAPLVPTVSRSNSLVRIQTKIHQ